MSENNLLKKALDDTVLTRRSFLKWSGVLGGTPGIYSIYVTWPMTGNISGDPINFDVTTAGDSLSTSFNTNNTGNEWLLVGTVNYTSGPITLTQSSTANTFVSMRSAGALFEGFRIIVSPVAQRRQLPLVCGRRGGLAVILKVEILFVR